MKNQLNNKLKIRIYQIVAVIFLAILAGCSFNEVMTRNYYVLEYFSHSEKAELMRDKPLNFSVMVMDSRVSRTYDRRQIVMRSYGPQIRYAEYDLWGVKLDDIIPNLISKRMKNYNSFRQVQREYFKELPDFQISTTINNVELLESDNISRARLNMEFVLKNAKTEELVLLHNVDRERDVLDGSLDTFVQLVNELVLEETDNFITMMYNKLSGETIEIVKEEEVVNLDFSLLDYFEEGTSEGSGLLFMPSLTQVDNEGYYQILDSQGNSTMGRFGEAEALPHGTYTIRYGSGDANQMMIKEGVKIIPRYRQIVEPDWGCLIVDIIDKNRNFSKVSYEVFSMESGESYGSEFPADEAVGEQDKIWVLKPGTYKITINNEPFNTYTNFTTVQVDANKAKQMTIVVDVDDDGNPLDLVGAGVLEDIFDAQAQSKIKYTHAIHANFNFISDNNLDEKEQIYSLTTNVQYDNKFEYDNYPYHYTLKSLIEEGLTKSSDTKFRKSLDDIDIRNTFLYYFFEDIGFYGRYDLNTHLMTNKVYLEDDQDYVKLSSDGDLEKYGTFIDKALDMDINPPIFPLEMRESIGVNYQILNRSKVNLSLRAGFGFRQTFNEDVYGSLDPNSSLAQQDSIDGVNVVNADKFIAIENSNTKGTELSAVASFELPIDLSYNTNLEILIPFDEDEPISADWENSFDLRLFKYVSLNYKLNLSNKTPEQGDEYWLTEHSLFLRITYFLQ